MPSRIAIEFEQQGMAALVMQDFVSRDLPAVNCASLEDKDDRRVKPIIEESAAAISALRHPQAVDRNDLEPIGGVKRCDSRALDWVVIPPRIVVGKSEARNG
jgi:hypothetical protein